MMKSATSTDYGTTFVPVEISLVTADIDTSHASPIVTVRLSYACCNSSPGANNATKMNSKSHDSKTRTAE